MEEEQLKIFDMNKNEIGIATRDDVHKFGYWHEVFHCWFVSKEEDTHYIHLQRRSKEKKDYPNLLDITAAGHLLADETVQDGVREIKEELGMDIAYEKLVPLGVFSYSVKHGNLIDNEFANIFLYNSEHHLNDFILQAEEVSGMAKARIKDFEQFWLGKKEKIKITGFVFTKGEKEWMEKYVGRDQFVPHQDSFYRFIIEKIKAQLT